MNIRYEFCGNPEYIEIHITVKLTENKFVSSTIEGDDKDNELLALVMGVNGVCDVNIRPYSVVVKRGGAFERDEVAKGVEDVLTMWVGETVNTRLPTLRSDIVMHQCSSCVAEQNRMIEETMKDCDTLEW